MGFVFEMTLDVLGDDLIDYLRDVELGAFGELEVHLIFRPRTEVALWRFLGTLRNFGLHGAARKYNRISWVNK